MNRRLTSTLAAAILVILAALSSACVFDSTPSPCESLAGLRDDRLLELSCHELYRTDYHCYEARGDNCDSYSGEHCRARLEAAQTCSELRDETCRLTCE